LIYAPATCATFAVKVTVSAWLARSPVLLGVVGAPRDNYGDACAYRSQARAVRDTLRRVNKQTDEQALDTRVCLHSIDKS